MEKSMRVGWLVKNGFTTPYRNFSGIFFRAFEENNSHSLPLEFVNMKHLSDAESVVGIYLIVILMIRNGL